MKILAKIKKYIPHILLGVLIIFNFYLYRSEFKVLSDPNDNTFHFALIDEAKTIWKQVFAGKISPMYLLDSWNERWAGGLSLSSYYSHLPEAVVSLLSFIIPISTYKLFIIIRTLFLILLPISFFMGARILGFSAGFGLIFAFFSQAVFTDGLYGLDSTSFLWRGWGLFTQLLAVFLLPLAFAYGVDYLKNKKNLGKAILFNFLLAQAHFGMFYLLIFSYLIFFLVPNPQGSVLREVWSSGKKLLILLFYLFVSLSYFIIPFFTTSQYRNFSLWDPIWKFNSWGMSQILTWFTNGDLFDFNRFPFLTIFIIGGILWGLVSKNKFYHYLVAIFIFYLILFFGRGVLGPLIDFVPGLGEYHLHRAIVMVQFVGLFIASGWVFSLLESLLKKKNIILTIFIVCLGFYFICLIEKPIINYTKDNDTWILRSNMDYQKNINDYQMIINNLKKLPPARIYAGRPGNWGKDFKIGDTQVYMALSSDGFPIIGFLPQSWSPNSDAEQFFDEENLRHYDLYNVGYLVLPTDKTPPQFSKLIVTKGKFSLYKVDSEGWFTIGKSSLEIMTTKNNLINITHLWFYSPAFINRDYPAIALNKEKFTFVDKIIKMSDQNIFDENKAIWQENPLFESKEKFEQSLTDKVEIKIIQGYSIDFKLADQCQKCILILKQTYHPNWKIILNGKNQKTFPVFPFFTGIQLSEAGEYHVTALYKPSNLKIILLVLSITFFIMTFMWLGNQKQK